jgi:hypothetical protein
MSIKDKYTVKSIDNFQCKEWLLYKHYLKRVPSISYAFGIFDDKILLGVITFGMPPSPPLCIGVCGEDYKDYVLELNRLVINEGLEKNILSYFIGESLRMLPKPLIIVSYAEKDFGHNGYIYQATNFIYTGLSEKRTDVVSDLHGRHAWEMKKEDRVYIDRARKHRYVYFVGNKKQVAEMKKQLRYKIEKYPKGDNKRYDANYKPTVQIGLF